jgi:hypothetical protein
LNLEQLKEKVTQKSLDFRSIREFLDHFYDIPITAEIYHAALGGNRKKIKQLFEENNNDLTRMGLSKLRQIAQGLGVLNYSRLTRGQLIQELKEYDKEAIKRCNRVNTRNK